MLRRALASSRWVVLIEVLGTLVACIALLIHGAIAVVETLTLTSVEAWQ